MKTKEELLKELSAINKEIAESVKKQAELYKELDSLDEAYDWVSVSKAAERIRTEERKHAEEKINAAHSGTARERFDAINNGLSNHAG